MASTESSARTEKKQNARGVRRFYALVVMFILILLLGIASVVLWILTPRPVTENQEGGVFTVKTITLLGNTKYSEEAVIGESGVLIGESIFSVSSRTVEEKLLATFPYFSSVQVQTLHMSEIQITVTETEVVAAMYADGFFVKIGSNGKALEKYEVTEDRPKGLLYLKGTDAPEGGVVVGGMAMDDYCADILQTLQEAFERYELTDVTEIDMTDKNDLQLTWNDRIVVKLGNASNLTHEIGVVATTIPKIVEERGSAVTGVLNVSSYSNEALENQAVFTPSSLLPTTTTASRRPATGETTTTATPLEDDTGSDDEDDSWDDDSWDDDSWDDEE